MRILWIDGREVGLCRGVTILAPGFVAVGRAYRGVAVVVLAFPCGDAREDCPGVGFDNVFGYDADGRCLWRIDHPDGLPPYAHYGPYLSAGRHLVVHTSGMAVQLDTPTGRVERVWDYRNARRREPASRHRCGSGVLPRPRDPRIGAPAPWTCSPTFGA